MFKLFRSFVSDESGATAIEYGLIAALVALVGVVAFTALGDTVLGAFTDIATALCEGTGKEFTLTDDGTGSCATAAAQ